ncbi:hypothetical protein [Lacrimispora algidixylanolytica]|uniref:Uncharacterized protein n=1 Tax=Lacrimispora algidixylanolytica TaxID=94868 RepID=A0A419SVV2_9FIRM|nr:hypothetical protein [Lacrimispora algidixylanolytica]RKD29347.1 hypothetical protein BET01_08335 [Lacrimispora algidixylanolytica]
MTNSYKTYRVYRYNNTRKPWRKVQLIAYKKKCFLYFVRLCLLLLVFLEASVLIPRCKEDLLFYTKYLFSINQELELQTKSNDTNRGNEGETKENGFFLDLKEGKVKIWKKVERVVYQKPD